MKIKNMKLMLLGLLAMGGMNAFAAVGDTFTDDYFKYEITAQVAASKSGEVTLAENLNPVPAACVIPGTREFTQGGVKYTFKVTKIATAALQNQLMTSLSIPAEVKEIENLALKGCTNLATLTIAEGSQLEKIGTSAFTSTHIKVFDFTKCTKLKGLDGMVFVETATPQKTNTFITTVLLPTTATFTKVSNALAYLPNLETTNLESTSIQSIDQEFLTGDAKLKKLELPGTVKTIATNAFKGSAVDSLVINVDAIDATNGIQADAYASATADKAKLKKLYLKGELKGTIASTAFNAQAGLTVLDLSGLSFGTNASVKANAFGALPAAITSVELKDIGDNGTGAYTIQAQAFNGSKLATVKIGKITASQAIEGNAFDETSTYTLTSVSIEEVNAASDGTKFPVAANAFNFAKITTALDAKVTIGTVRSKSLKPVFGAGAFTFDAANDATKATATIKIGAITSAGKVFTAGTFANANAFKSVSMTFTGAIEYNGIDEAILDDNTKLATLTFKGAIAHNGIGKGAFAQIGDGLDPTKITTVVTFEGKLAAAAVGTAKDVDRAVAAGAFELGTTNNQLTVKYTATPDDPTLLPFAQDAFGDGSNTTWPTALASDDDRSVTLVITNEELKEFIKSNQISYTDAANRDKDIIYCVILTLDDLGLVVYQKDSGNTSYGRISLVNMLPSINKGLVIPRRQNGITYTLYTTYIEDDTENEVLTINMQPMVSKNGLYEIKKGDIAAGVEGKIDVIILKAVGTTESETKVDYTDEVVTTTSTFYTDGRLAQYNGTDNVTNEQLIDGSAVAPFNVPYYDGDGKAIQDIYFLSNPADHKGISANYWDIKTSGVYVAPRSFFVIAPHYGKASGAARIVWLGGDDDETTGISNVKAIANDGIIYNMAGQQVDANYKGIVIKNGKKMIQK